MQSDGAIRELEDAPSLYCPILLTNVRLALGVALVVFGAMKPLAMLNVWSNRRRIDDSSTMMLDQDSTVSFPRGYPDCFSMETDELTTFETCRGGFVL